MSDTATTSLLLEIGCEEIPARFLADAERDLGEHLASALKEARLTADAGMAAVKTASTPRRLIAYVPALLGKQPDRAEQLVGPPSKTAFDAQGKLTRAAESFAAKNHRTVAELKRINTAKGEYIALEISEPGSPASEVLRELLPAALRRMTFPKNMYWTSKSLLFVRPIRWILALLGDKDGVRVVPFAFAGVSSGSVTYGHRLNSRGPVEVATLDLDLVLERHGVVADRRERRERIRAGIKALLEESMLNSPQDEFLEEWVVNSTEWPLPLMGDFDRRYLALPREVLVTVMRDHQKYFSVEDRSGNLQPHFITVLNVAGDPKGVIRRGHERVLTARFADAEFFWHADQKIPLRERTPMLERVTYQAKLGTYAEKVRRMTALAEKICAELERSGQMSAKDRAHALRAVELCKCDLTTQMVQEFTELQGVIGGLYAKAQSEPAEVTDAIYDHYRPAGAGDSCPRSAVGAVVSFADKLDAVVAGFSAGLEPTGSSDPFGLRRAANGVVKLSVDALPSLHLDEAIETAAEIAHAQNYGDKIRRFFLERIEFYLREIAGLRYDTVRAVLSDAVTISGARAPANALERARSLDRVRDSEDFGALAAGAKRTRNILSKSAQQEAPGEVGVDSAILEEASERELYAAYRELVEKLRTSGDGGYDEAFRAMAAIRPSVDRFFDNVLVMTDDPRLRRNRLRLLRALDRDVFTRFADIGEIAVSARGATQ